LPDIGIGRRFHVENIIDLPFEDNYETANQMAKTMIIPPDKPTDKKTLWKIEKDLNRIDEIPVISENDEMNISGDEVTDMRKNISPQKRLPSAIRTSATYARYTGAATGSKKDTKKL
jgi:hypothetical protein